MDQRRRAVLHTAARLMIISLISFLIKEVCYIEVQASSLFLDKAKHKVVIVAADYIELEDFAQHETLTWLFNNSYSALISGRQNGKASLTKAKLIIGSGQRLEINSSLDDAINYSSSFEGLTNDKVLGQPGNVIYQNIRSLKNLNKNSDYQSYIGYLGKELNNFGMHTCIIGNSDTNIMNRSSILMVMNESGMVDTGEVEDTLVYDSSFPGGKKTDYDKLLEEYKRYRAESDLIVIDTGDLARLEYYKNGLLEEDFKLHRKEVINNIAGFYKELISTAKEDTTFLLLSAYPSGSSMKTGFKLTPFIVYDSKDGGLLYSSSTKRTGIITNLDIADYILERLTIRDDSNLEQVLTYDSMSRMLELKRRLLSVSIMRLPVLTWYAIFEIICAIAGFLYMLNFNPNRMKFIKLVKITMLANIVAPAILLYMSIFKIDHVNAYFGIFILLSYVTAAILFFLFKTFINQFLGAALFVNASIGFDLFSESAFIKNSVFGYDPIIGARFYGIGNEFAGVFIGCGILAAGCVLQRFAKGVEKRPKLTLILLIIYICFQIYMMGMPFMGANFGGTIAAITAYYFFISSIRKRKIRIAQILILAFVLVIALSSIITLDLLNSSNTSHIGKFITDIRENGLNILFSTLSRKLAMNLRLIKYTIWTKVLLCIILIITIMFFKPVQLLHNIFKKYRYIAAAWIGISAGSIAGLIINDSGIVMAATAMIFTGYTILYMCLEERSASN
ncbi:MAG: hypothetical protein K0R80_79 [Clostridia bacterium]|nr:hypothetical protein [Clostridia bacterium]